MRLAAVEQFIVHPAVVAEAVERAVQTIIGEGREQQLEGLTREISAKEQELERLVEALAAGGDSGALVNAIKARETQLGRLRPQLASVQGAAIDFDRGKLKRELVVRAKEWKALLRGTPQAAQRALRALIADWLTFTPVDDGDSRHYAFSGVGTVAPILEGIALVQNVASPPGTHNLYTIPMKTRAG